MAGESYFHMEMDPEYAVGIGDTLMHPVIADRDFILPNGQVVHAGDTGGYIEHEGNLAQDGSWISDDVFVYGEAEVKDGALVENKLFGDRDFNQIEICGQSEISGPHTFHFVDSRNESCYVENAVAVGPEGGHDDITFFHGAEDTVFTIVSSEDGGTRVTMFQGDRAEEVPADHIEDNPYGQGDGVCLSHVLGDSMAAVDGGTDSGLMEPDWEITEDSDKIFLAEDTEPADGAGAILEEEEPVGTGGFMEPGGYSMSQDEYESLSADAIQEGMEGIWERDDASTDQPVFASEEEYYQFAAGVAQEMEEETDGSEPGLVDQINEELQVPGDMEAPDTNSIDNGIHPEGLADGDVRDGMELPAGDTATENVGRFTMDFMKNDTARGREPRVFCVSERDFHQLPFLKGLMEEDNYKDLMESAKTSYSYTVGKDSEAKTMQSPMEVTYEPVFSVERQRGGQARVYDVAGILTLKVDIDGEVSNKFEGGEYTRSLLVTDAGGFLSDLDAGTVAGNPDNHILPVEFDGHNIPRFENEFSSLANLRIFGFDAEAREKKEAHMEAGMQEFREFLIGKLETGIEVSGRTLDAAATNLSELHAANDTMMGYRDFLYEETQNFAAAEMGDTYGQLDLANYLVTIADEYRVSDFASNILHARSHTDAFQIIYGSSDYSRYPAVADAMEKLENGSIPSLNAISMEDHDFSDQSDAILLGYFRGAVEDLYGKKLGSDPEAVEAISGYAADKDGKTTIRWDDIQAGDKEKVYSEMISLLKENRDEVYKQVDPAGRIDSFRDELDAKNEKIDALTGDIVENYGRATEISKSTFADKIVNGSFKADMEYIRTGSPVAKRAGVSDMARTLRLVETMPQGFERQEAVTSHFDREDFRSRLNDRINGDGIEKVFFDRDGTPYYGDGMKVVFNTVEKERNAMRGDLYKPEMDRVYEGTARPSGDIARMVDEAVVKRPDDSVLPHTSRHETGIPGIDENVISYMPDSVRTWDMVRVIGDFLKDEDKEHYKDLEGRFPLWPELDNGVEGSIGDSPGHGQPEAAGVDADLQGEDPVETGPSLETPQADSPTQQPDAQKDADSYKRSVGPKGKIIADKEVEISQEKLDEIASGSPEGKIEDLKGKLDAVKSDILHYKDEYQKISDMLGNDQRDISRFTPAQIIKANFDAACRVYADLGGKVGEGCFVTYVPTDREIQKDYMDFRNSNYYESSYMLEQLTGNGSVREFEAGMYEKKNEDGSATGERANVYSASSNDMVHGIGLSLSEGPLGWIAKSFYNLTVPSNPVKDPISGKDVDKDGGANIDGGADRGDPTDGSNPDPGTGQEDAVKGNDIIHPGNDMDIDGGMPNDIDQTRDSTLDTHEEGGLDKDTGGEVDPILHDGAVQPAPDDAGRHISKEIAPTHSQVDVPVDPGKVTEAPDSNEKKDTADTDRRAGDTDGLLERLLWELDPEFYPNPDEAADDESAQDVGQSADKDKEGRETSVDAAASLSQQATVPDENGSDYVETKEQDSRDTADAGDKEDTEHTMRTVDPIDNLRNDLDQVFEHGTDGEEMENLKEDIADAIADKSLSPEDLFGFLADYMEETGIGSEDDAMAAGEICGTAVSMAAEGEQGETSPVDFVAQVGESLETGTDGREADGLLSVFHESFEASLGDVDTPEVESSFDPLDSGLHTEDLEDSLDFDPDIGAADTLAADIRESILENDGAGLDGQLLDGCIGNVVVEALASGDYGDGDMDSQLLADLAVSDYNDSIAAETDSGMPIDGGVEAPLEFPDPDDPDDVFQGAVGDMDGVNGLVDIDGNYEGMFDNDTIDDNDPLDVYGWDI